nr:tail fiber protein [uncultured Mediterranean phage uvMED]
MADRATQVVNFYETAITNSDFSAGATSFTVGTTPTTNGSTGITSATTGNQNSWVYLVIDPDSTSNREIVVVKTHSSGSTTFSDVERDYDGRQEAAGAPADTGISHGIGTTVRLAVLAQHIQDQNDRVATNITSLTTAVSDFNTNSASAITTFNSNGTTAINDINASSATAMINNATSGTGITVDTAADFILVYDATDSTSKKVYVSQVAVPADIHPFLIMGG